MNKKLHMGARLILGLGLFIFGLNGFLQFMQVPSTTPEAGALLGAFAKTGYFFPMIKIIELSVGVLLLANFFAPLAVVLITPVLVGITTIHLFLNPAGLPMMIFLHVLHAIIAYGYRGYYKSIFTKKAELN
jgi:hypothetical protein